MNASPQGSGSARGGATSSPGNKLVQSGSSMSPSTFSAVVESGQQVLFVNSDQLSLLQNSQGIVVMQSADPKTLQVSLWKRLSHLNDLYFVLGSKFMIYGITINWLFGQLIV